MSEKLRKMGVYKDMLWSATKQLVRLGMDWDIIRGTVEASIQQEWQTHYIQLRTEELKRLKREAGR